MPADRIATPHILLVIGGTDSTNALADAIAAGSRIGVLCSFVYRSAWETFVQRLNGRNRWDYLLLDCGAFTALNSGKPISLTAYCKWLEYMIPTYQPDRYAALDVIGDPDQGHANAEAMWKSGFKDAFPTWHAVEKTKDLLRVCGSHREIGIGFPSPFPAHQHQQYYDHVFTHAHENSVHLWRCLREDILIRYPAASADASSWTQCVRYGGLKTRHGTTRISRDPHTKATALALAIQQYEDLQRRVQAIHQSRKAA